MGLLSFFKRSAAAPAVAPGATSNQESIDQARTRARHRLIGAAVLVGIGVIGFPLVFESEPRSIRVDIPIEIPRKETAPLLPVPAPRPVTEAPKPADVIDESAADAGQEVTPPPPPPAASVAPQPEARVATAPAQAASAAVPKPQPPVRPEPRPEAKPEPKPEPKPEAKPAPRPEPPKAAPTDAARAQALLEGKDTPRAETPKPAAAENGRFIVQVGAYGEAGSARDARQKVERLGLKTYTQVVQTGDGQRIRVRVGPFASRSEAEQAANKLKAAGLPSALLAL